MRPNAEKDSMCVLAIVRLVEPRPENAVYNQASMFRELKIHMKKQTPSWPGLDVHTPLPLPIDPCKMF